MDIQVGDKVTYIFLKKDNKKEAIIIVDSKAEAKELQNMQKENSERQIKILKIERPKYEVIEEKKELLTKEEKEFLKSYIKVLDEKNNIKFIERFMNELYIHTDITFYRLEINIGFNGLQKEKSYTLEELGL